MATYSWVVQINAGASAAPAKRIQRQMLVQAGAGDEGNTRRPTQVAEIGAEAGVTVERAATWLRAAAVGAEGDVALGPKLVTKVIQIAAGAGALTRVGGSGVVSYLRQRSNALDLEGFLAATRHGPAGYTDFVRVYPGEYVFKDAVVRSVMLTREPTTMPKLTRLKPIIDVPDRILHGTITITDALAGADIVFTPEFYTAPEVAVLWQSGATVGVARRLAPTRAGVNVYIEDPSTPGARLTGTVSYMIQGY